MRVFIGSSSLAESTGDLSLVREHIRLAGLLPEPWTEADTLEIGASLWSTLLNKTRDVDAAAFIFREDDQLQTLGVSTTTVRDNVLLEFGLFSGALFSRSRRGNPNCVIFIRGKPKIPGDLEGILHISLDAVATVQSKVDAWARSIRAQVGEHVVLESSQIIEIVRAMLKSGVAIDGIYKLMARLDVLPAEVNLAIAPPDPTSSDR